MDDRRRQLAETASEAAAEVAEVLDKNPVRANQPFPVAEVLGVLEEKLDELRNALRECPVPVAVDENGKSIDLGASVAGLAGYLQHIAALYHGLEDIPAHMRAQANRDLSATHLRARKLRGRPSRR